MNSQITQPIMVYLAGPVDGVEDARSWREEVAANHKGNICFFSPAHAYLSLTRASFPAADFLNRICIDQANGVLVNLVGGYGFGSIREVEHARRTQTPVVIVDPESRLAHSLMTMDLAIERDLDSGMVKLLEKITDARNQPPSFMGIPVTEWRPVDPENDQ